MAIVKVGTYRNPPEDITDYTAISAHLDAYLKQVGGQGMILTQWTNDTTKPDLALGSYIQHGGTLYVSSTETAITAPVADGTYYLKVAASGDTLVLSWIASLTGYAWNAIYNGLYHADESQILPYMLVVSGTVTVFSKRKIVNLANGANGLMTGDYLGNATVGGTLGVTGAISGASLKLTTSTYGNQSIDAGGSWVVPQGIYQMAPGSASISVEIYHGSLMVGAAPLGGVVSDGINVKVKNTSSVSQTVQYLKFS